MFKNIFFFLICIHFNNYDLTKQRDSEMSNRSRITTKTTKWLCELQLKSLGMNVRCKLEDGSCLKITPHMKLPVVPPKILCNICVLHIQS